LSARVADPGLDRARLVKSLVIDERELERFVAWLPPIGVDEAYLLQLMVRSRGLKERYGFKGTDHVLLQKAVHGYHYQRDPQRGWEYWRTRLLYEIQRIGTLAGSAPWEYVRYREGTKEIEEIVLVPPPLMAIYIHLNPSRVLDAALDAIKDVVTSITTIAKSASADRAVLMREVYKRPDLRYYSGLARRQRTVFHSVDVDAMEIVTFLENEFVEVFGFVPPRITTHRGKHFLINLEELRSSGLLRRYVGPVPPRVKKAMERVKSMRSVCLSSPERCAEDLRVIEGFVRDRSKPMFHRLTAMSYVYVDERGVPLVEVKSQALEPAPGTLYKGEVVVRLELSER